MPKARDMYDGALQFSSYECLVCGAHGTVNVCNTCNEVGCGDCFGTAGTRCRECRDGFLENITFRLIRMEE